MEALEMAQTGSLTATKHEASGGFRHQLEAFLPPILGGLVLLLVLVGLIGTALQNPKPHDLPVGLVGPGPAVQQISSSFAKGAPGTFLFTTFGSETDARAALDTRSVDGILVIGSGGPHLIVAGAAGDAVTGVLAAAFGNAFHAQGTDLTVETTHPFAAGDAHGLILFFLVVALFISTLAAQALLLARGGAAGLGPRLGVVVAYAVLAALGGMGAATWIAGDYGAGFWAATALLALASLALGAVVAGAGRLLGNAGIGLVGLLVVLLGLVTSGGPVGSQMLPDAYRALAPWLPAAALYAALRGALYFAGAGVAQPVLVLSGWLLFGLVMMVAGERLARRRRAAVIMA
jgi:hypothetical protein